MAIFFSLSQWDKYLVHDLHPHFLAWNQIFEQILLQQGALGGELSVTPASKKNRTATTADARGIDYGHS
jgi:hypothetical protein